MMNELEPVLLRSFLAVLDTLSVTEAADRLGLGQPTVSQHLRRLETAVGRTLLRRTTRSVRPTADGTAMAVFARDILAAQARALNHFAPGRLRGTLRLGVTEDLTLTRLPEILRRFRSAHPDVELRLEVGLSSPLNNRLNDGGLDLLFAKRLEPHAPGLAVWREKLVWLASPDWHPVPDAPVPLVCFPNASITRDAAVSALENAALPWRQSVASPSLPALLAALRAGFGVSAQVALLAGEGLEVVSDAAGLPALPEVDFVLLERPGTIASEPARRLMRMILDERRVILSRPGAS
ncbi:LysR substrate-binding domain-containing protein [Acetobacteraceae bacterium KSS8]|uniref:LysR substrate-binding domain-containing protein n=1 Tax=Endosaccharibacter trunci TaxID=2812733 RepID=A0ABT1W408_9PROT|nr:LysR substrate-binding domain-containing protein [Acetobacteraceae bacterium KSS8]